jgi:hypothetical protein
MQSPSTSAIALPGVEMTIYCRRDDADGGDQICLVVDERDYFELEKRAPRRGKTVEQDLYCGMIDALQSHGFNTPPDCFFVSVDVPAEDAPPRAPRRTLQ